MNFFLRIYRIAAIFLWFIFIVILIMPHHFRGWKGRKKIHQMVHLWNRGLAKILNLRVKVSGQVPKASKGMVISNHLSYIDIIAHGTALPIRYSPKSEVARWPVFGWMTALSCPIWIDREFRHASNGILKDFAETMKNGIYPIVYPEGTSSDGKSGILPFKSTPFEAVVAENLPVFPVLTCYRESPGKNKICWYGDMTLLPHLWEVLGSSSMEAELCFLPPVFPEGRTRKEMASFVHETMSREYERIIDE